MRTLSVVSRDPLMTARMRRLLDGGLDLLPLGSLQEAVAPNAAGVSDVLLVDFGSAFVSPDDLGAVHAQPGRPFLVGLVPAESPNPPGVERCDLVLSRELPDPPLRAAIEQGLRVRRLAREVASFRQHRARSEGAVPSPLAVLLRDEEGRYRVRGQRGLDPVRTEFLRLDPTEGLAAWFRQHARLAVRPELEREPEWLDAGRELALLGGEVAVPLWVQAKLVGILTLGPRVTGQPYSGEDLERLFTLASHVAMAVEDIVLFNTVRAQHGFIEQVLAHLECGAITIDATARVTRFETVQSGRELRL